MSGPTIDRLLVAGVGLIGGSLALALKRAGVVSRVTGFGRNSQNLERARELGVIDDFVLDLQDAAPSADVVFLGVPVGAMEPILRALAPLLRADAVITDGGSTKSGPLAAAREGLDARFSRFVPGHPIAGSERSGVEAAHAGLYDHHKVLLTPAVETDPDALETVELMWRAAGASVERMDAAVHDRVLGLTSHLPHLLAFALVDFIARGDDAECCFDLAAGGFIDFTRIASSDPVMWRDISIDNTESLSRSLEGFIEALEHVKQLVETRSGAELESVFRNAREAREKLIDKRNL